MTVRYKFEHERRNISTFISKKLELNSLHTMFTQINVKNRKKNVNYEDKQHETFIGC